ncbi:hypothetical protein BJV77DRAFT_1002928 [Russula vinacea]|nr:hypothetical protein BJV77DRAFT_1002928 [Russula vinacea]
MLVRPSIGPSYTPRQMKPPGFMVLPTTRVTMRNSPGNTACLNFVRGLVLSLFVASHQLPRKNASFPCACVFFCVRASCRLLSAWVLIPLPFGTIASYSPFFRSIDTNFPFPTSSAPCVLLHSFSLCFLSWDIFIVPPTWRLPGYFEKSASEPTFTASPVFHEESQTPTTLSTPTPVNPQVDADPGQDSGSAPSPPPAPTPPSGSHLSSANAGVALASHGTVLVALTGLLGTVLAF